MPPATGQNARMQQSSARWILSASRSSCSPPSSASCSSRTAQTRRTEARRRAQRPASTPVGVGLGLAAELARAALDRPLRGHRHNAEREAAGEPINTDALMLVSLSADQSALTLVSLPRDTVDVPLPDGGSYEGKINELYRDEGIEALRGAMETLYDVPIDAHVVLDMDDVAALVEAAGGVEVNPPAAAGRPDRGPGPPRRAAGARRRHRPRLRPHAGRPGLRPHAAPAGGHRRHWSSA